MSQGISSELLSEYNYKFDVKNRVSVPSEWRPDEGCSLLLLESSREGLPVIKVLTREKFAEWNDTIKNGDYTPAEKDLLIGRLHSRCCETTVNGQGKMLVPKRMIEKGGYGIDVKIVGRGGYFEIWRPELFEQAEALEEARLKTLNANLGFF